MVNRYGIKDLNHIGLNVKYMEDSIRFYEEVLGFERLGTIVDQKDLLCRCQYFKMPGGAMLELIEYYPEKNEIDTGVTDAGIYRHIALTVAEKRDLEILWKRFVDAKSTNYPSIELCSPPDYLPYLDLDLILIKDMNGVEIEFCRKRTVDRYEFPDNLVV